MILNWLDIVFMTIYFLGLVAFGLIVRRIRSFSEYAVGSRAVPLAMIFASLSATYIGPGYTMGFAGKGFTSGWLFFYFALAFTLQTLVVAFFIAPKLHGFKDCFTVGDVIGRVHGKAAHLITGIISALLCIGFTAIMAKVGGIVVQGTLGWPLLVGVIIVSGVGILYCVTGGLQSVIATESIQFSLFAVIVPVLLWFIVFSSDVDLKAVNTAAMKSAYDTAVEMGPMQIFGLIVSFLLGETLIPPYANRALAAGSSSIARSGFFAGAIYSVIWFGIVIAIGIVGRQLLPEVGADEIFMSLAARYLPHGVLGLLVVAVIAIIMSSQESVINAGAVSITRDISDTILPGKTDAQRLRLSRTATVGVGIAAAAMAVYAPSIIDGLLIIYSIWAPSVLPVLVLAVLLPMPPRAAAAPAILTGALVSLAWQFLLKDPWGVPGIIMGLVSNLAVYSAVGFATRSSRKSAHD